MCNFAVNNSCFTDYYKQYHIHNDNDKIKPPDRYLFLNLMSKIVSLYRFTILPRFPDPKLCKSYPVQILILSRSYPIQIPILSTTPVSVAVASTPHQQQQCKIYKKLS